MFSNDSARPGTLRPRTRVRGAAVTVLLTVGGVLAGTAPSAQAAHHSGVSQCRGRGVDTTALVRYRADIVIQAQLSTIWKLQTDIERWPSWQPPRHHRRAHRQRPPQKGVAVPVDHPRARHPHNSRHHTRHYLHRPGTQAARLHPVERTRDR